LFNSAVEVVKSEKYQSHQMSKADIWRVYNSTNNIYITGQKISNK